MRGRLTKFLGLAAGGVIVLVCARIFFEGERDHEELAQDLRRAVSALSRGTESERSWVLQSYGSETTAVGLGIFALLIDRGPCVELLSWLLAEEPPSTSIAEVDWLGRLVDHPRPHIRAIALLELVMNSRGEGLPELAIQDDSDAVQAAGALCFWLRGAWQLGGKERDRARGWELVVEGLRSSSEVRRIFSLQSLVVMSAKKPWLVVREERSMSSIVSLVERMASHDTRRVRPWAKLLLASWNG